MEARKIDGQDTSGQILDLNLGFLQFNLNHSSFVDLKKTVFQMAWDVQPPKLLHFIAITENMEIIFLPTIATLTVRGSSETPTSSFLIHHMFPMKANPYKKSNSLGTLPLPNPFPIFFRGVGEAFFLQKFIYSSSKLTILIATPNESIIGQSTPS